MNRVRIRTRFGIRTLLLAVGAVGVCLGLWASLLQPYHRRAGAVRTLEWFGADWESRPVAPHPFLRFLTPVDGRQAVTRVDLQEVLALTDENVWGFTALFKEPLAHVSHGDTHRGVLLSALANLSELEELRLPYSGVTDEQFARLGGKPDLELLVLTGCPVTDASVPALSRGFPRLTELYIRWTAISPAGAERLRQQLPDCRVYYCPRPAESTAVGDRES